MTRKRKRLPIAQRRARIVQAAIHCFGKSGFAGTTSRMLARRAGVSEALLYRHFPDKRALYSEIVALKVRDEEAGLFPEKSADARDDGGVLSSIAEALLRHIERDPNFLRLLTFSCLEGTALAKRYFQARDRTVSGFLTNYLRGRMDEGALRKSDPEVAARAFLGMILHYLHLRHVLRLPVKRRHSDELVPQWVEMFLGGMRC